MYDDFGVCSINPGPSGPLLIKKKRCPLAKKLVFLISSGGFPCREFPYLPPIALGSSYFLQIQGLPLGTFPALIYGELRVLDGAVAVCCRVSMATEGKGKGKKTMEDLIGRLNLQEEEEDVVGHSMGSLFF